jgi:hypothetical protein
MEAALEHDFSFSFAKATKTRVAETRVLKKNFKVICYFIRMALDERMPRPHTQ